MASINQVQKTSYDAIRLDYTDKDYVNILDDLINSIPGITQKWISTDTNDPGMILVKLMAIIGDMLFYTQDMQSLEVYPSSVTQRKNAAAIYRLIGYKMRWYKSAEVQVNVINTYSQAATLPMFCTFTTEDNTITYCNVTKLYELPSNMYNNGLETVITLTQGIPVTPVRVSSNPYPEAGKPWHSIYGFNYTTEDVINNRIYLPHNNIDQDHIILIDDQNEVWELRENIYLTSAVGRFFEFGVDVNDNPYIELVDYYNNFNVNRFKLFYIISQGESGQIYANTLKNITGNVWARDGSDISTVYNVSGFIHFTNYDSTEGYNPETPDEARKNSVKYLNTMDTLITLADFERATLREWGVANVRATDLTNDPGMEVSWTIGNVNMDRTAKPVDGKVVYSEIIDETDMNAVALFIQDPKKYPLTEYQQQLADANQDGRVTEEDLDCFTAYFNGDTEHSGYIGVQQVKQIETLDSFVVKLYILRNEVAQDEDIESYSNMIITDLSDYKILPLTILVDLESIKKYYWSIEGTFFTKTPLSKDELQTIIVTINNNLRYKYALDKINFNTLIDYKEVIETILDVDSRILMVDLEPIKYKDDEGEVIDPKKLTGLYRQIIPQLNYSDPSSNLTYHFYLEETSILPGSVMLRINNGQYVLKDNNNGDIYNVDNVLVRKGSIDYITGEVNLEFNAPLTSDIVVDYTHNETAIAVYNNLNTQTFYFDSSSLEKTYMEDMI